MSLLRLSLAAISLTLLAAAFIAANAEPMGRIFWHLLTVHDLPAAWLMVAILALGYWMGTRLGEQGAWVAGLLAWIDRHRYAIAIVLWVGLCGASVFVYHNHPLSMDEYAAVFQAKVFAAGALHGQFPPEVMDYVIPRGFQNHFLMGNRHTGAVFSAYWPGFSLLLVPFVALDVPWACNPTLVTMSFLLIGRIARDVAPGTLAPGWAMLLALASPAFSANGITYYSMPAHLLFNLGFAWLLLAPSPGRLFLAGIVGGYAFVLHNPFPHLVFALPWIGWLVVRRDGRLRDLAWLALGYAPVLAVLGVGWSLWQREMLQAGAAMAASSSATGEASSMVERLTGLVRGFLRFVQWPNELIVYARLGGLIKLWLWGAPLLLLLAWWGGRREQHAGIRLMGASALLTFFAYFTIRFDQGHGWGYRYFHSAWGVLPILAAVGAVKLVVASNEGARWGRTLAALTLVSLVAANGLRFFQMGNFMSDHIAQSPPRVSAGFELVMHNDRGYYAHDLIQNDPWLRGNSVVVLANNKEDQLKLLSRFRDRFEAPPTLLTNRFGITYADRPVSAGR